MSQVKPQPQPKPGQKPSPEKPTPTLAVFGNDAAPMIFFDGPVAVGFNNGVVQVELAANTIVPLSLDKPETKTRTVVTGHLRCSVIAAQQLRDLLDNMLKPASEQTRQ